MHEIVETLMRLAAQDAEHYARAKQRNAMLYTVAAVIGLTAYACLVAAGVLLIARWSDPLIAATFAAAACAALALVIVAVVAVLNRRDRVWMGERRQVYTNALVTVAGQTLGPKVLALVAATMLAGMIFTHPAGPEEPGDGEQG